MNKELPILPQYARWRPSLSDARYIEVKLPIPYGGHAVNRYTVAQYNSLDELLVVVTEYIETVGNAHWSDFPNTNTPSIKHSKRSRVAGGETIDVGMIVAFDGVETKHFTIGRRSLKQAVGEAAAFILDSGIPSTDSACGTLELLAKRTVLSKVEADALAFYVAQGLPDENAVTVTLEQSCKIKLGMKVYSEVVSALTSAWHVAPESKQAFIDALNG